MTKYESTDPHCFYFVKSLKPEMEMNKSQVVIRLPRGVWNPAVSASISFKMMDARLNDFLTITSLIRLRVGVIPLTLSLIESKEGLHDRRSCFHHLNLGRFADHEWMYSNLSTSLRILLKCFPLYSAEDSEVTTHFLPSNSMTFSTTPT